MSKLPPGFVLISSEVKRCTLSGVASEVALAVLREDCTTTSAKPSLAGDNSKEISFSLPVETGTLKRLSGSKPT